MIKEMQEFLNKKRTPKITLDNDCWFYYVDVNGENVFQTESKYQQAMFATELKIKLGLI
jgi:cytoskeletal protein RodZ